MNLIAHGGRREAVLSSRIEGTKTSFTELLQDEITEISHRRHDADLQEVQNYVIALEYGITRLKSLPLSLRLVRRLVGVGAGFTWRGPSWTFLRIEYGQMSDNPLWRKDGFTLSTDKALLDLDVIHGFLSQSYWARGISRETVAKSIANTALYFCLYDGNPTEGKAAQVGFARVISDLATFAYLADVFVLPAYRGRGLSKWLMQTICEHPDLQGLRRFLLATQDAHGLYAQFGFTPLPSVERWMAMTRV